MDAYGITKKDWGVLRNTPLASHKGSKYFDVTAIGDIELMAKVQGMILSETAMAAPRPTVRVQAFMHGGKKASDPVGIARRAMFQFKGFPVSILMNQWSREFTGNTMQSKVLGMGSLIVGTTVLGMMSYNLKEIAKGRTPMDWLSKELAWNGFVQGGAFGLMGDALFLDPDKPGGMAEFVLGPMFGEAISVLNDFVKKPIGDLIEQNGKFSEHLVSNAVKFGKRNVPAPMNLPIVKQAWVRATWDQLDKMGNPGYAARQRQVKRDLAKTGQKQWF
jgi:hypothetical protein